MVKTVEAKGDSIDAAIANALAQLQKERDEVTVEVLEKGKSGFFGIGAQPALVRVSYETSRLIPQWIFWMACWSVLA